MKKIEGGKNPTTKEKIKKRKVYTWERKMDERIEESMKIHAMMENNVEDISTDKEINERTMKEWKKKKWWKKD